MNALLEVEDLRIRFSSGSRLSAALTGAPAWIEAVAGVSFSIQPGETYALVGESGSGKTSLARGIVGLVPVHSGAISFQGGRISRLTEKELLPVRREIGLIFQDPIGSLSPRLSIRSILAEPFRVHRRGDLDVDAEVVRLLEDVGLPASFLSRYPHQLSGGQARRIGVARALALRPKMLIADEPTAGLDVSVQGELLNLLNELQTRLGIAILIITHNLNVVRHVADRVAVMYLGRIVEEGLTADVFARPRHRYTAALLSANPVPDPDDARDRLEIEGDVPSLIHRPPGCEFHPRCPFAVAPCSTVFPAYTSTGAAHRFACHNPADSTSRGR
jgi:oligopeptide/dipeptide ABC transporter ATP-binding protein